MNDGVDNINDDEGDDDNDDDNSNKTSKVGGGLFTVPN